MKRFEYKKFFLMDSIFEEVHNEHGLEGWEIFKIDIEQKVCYMKREIPVRYEYTESSELDSMIKKGWEPISMISEKYHRMTIELERKIYLFKRPKP